VPALWDLSLVPADNPALGSAPSPRKEYYSVVYEGYLKIPADGVYTLHAPREYVYPDVDAGYEIQVELGDSYYARGARQEKYGREEWYPSTRLHGFGTWSTPLKQGLHPFRVVFLDYRKNILKKVNRTGLPDFVWSGSTPEIKVSGPDMNPQPIPVDWFYHKD